MKEDLQELRNGQQKKHRNKQQYLKSMINHITVKFATYSNFLAAIWDYLIIDRHLGPCIHNVQSTIQIYPQDYKYFMVINFFLAFLIDYVIRSQPTTLHAFSPDVNVCACILHISACLHIAAIHMMCFASMCVCIYPGVNMHNCL